MKRCVLILYLLMAFCKAWCQPKQIDGLVFDNDSKERIALVNITNTRTKESVFNNLKAEFHITARPGDKLIFYKQNYYRDTLTVKNAGPLAVYLKPTSIMLRQVDIRDTIKSPQRKLEETKEAYSKVYGSLANRNVLTTSPFGGGAGIGIDALYNLFSRSGRNAEHLRNTIERDYHESLIDYRFNKSLVANVTGLKDPTLTDFMQKYRPGYYQVISASDYDFIKLIRTSYRRYLRNPKAFSLPQLPKIPVQNE